MEVAREYSSLAPLLRDIALNGLPDDATTIYEGRNRVVTLSRDGVTFCIKKFRTPGAVKGYWYGRYSHSKAHRSYEYAVRLTEMGFATPAPVAYMERISPRGRLLESYYVCLYLPDALPVWRYELTPEFPGVSKAVAADLAAMHRQGVHMPDFTPGNILVTPEGAASGTPTVYYVDLNRTCFGVFSRRILRRSFNSPFYNDHSIEHFLRDYAEVALMPLSQVTAEAMAARRRYNRLKRLAHPIRYMRRDAR